MSVGGVCEERRKVANASHREQDSASFPNEGICQNMTSSPAPYTPSVENFANFQGQSCGDQEGETCADTALQAFFSNNSMDGGARRFQTTWLWA